ncbi:hypothetical protein Q1695_003246 [Nippostrongylus brasiliensis]|nr:hypothetical protein Q1695_003246 [Nippostrongylus brasiliensis]
MCYNLSICSATVVASTSDWSSPPPRRSISTVCGPSEREIHQFYGHFFPEKEVPQEYGVFSNTYMNHNSQQMFFGARCPENSAPVYDPGRFSPPQLDTPPPPVLNTTQEFNSGTGTGDEMFSYEKHNNNCWSSSAKTSATRKFSVAANFFSPPPQRPEHSSNTVSREGMLGYQPQMPMNNTYWAKNSFQQPSVPAQQPNMLTPQRKLSIAPMEVSIASPPFEPPPPVHKVSMDQNVS